MKSSCCPPGSVAVRSATRALVIACTMWGGTPGWAQQDDIRPFLPVLASGGNTTIQLRWSPPAGEEVRGYRVYWAGADRPFLYERSLQNPTCTVVGLINGAEYNLVITAVLTDDREWRGYRTVAATPERTVPMDPKSVSDVPAGVLRLELSDRIAGLKQWEVFRYGDPDHRLVRQDGSALTAALDPGFYQVAIRTLGSARELIWPEVVGLAAGDDRTITLASGIELSTAPEFDSIESWGTERVEEPGIRQWQSGAQRIMLRPPGKYRLVFQPHRHGSAPVVWPVPVEVPEEGFARASLDSGIRLDLPAETGDIYQWDVVTADDPNTVVQFYASLFVRDRAMLLPPGDYLVGLQPSEHWSNRIVWPEVIHVQTGVIETVRPRSGIRLDLPEDVGSIWAWQVSAALTPNVVLQVYSWDMAKLRSMLIPPGEYLVSIKPTSHNSQWLSWPERIRVDDGQFSTLSIKSGIQLDLPEDVGSIWAWQVSAAHAPNVVLQVYWWNMKLRSMLIPPGEYLVSIKPTSHNSQWLSWPERIRVDDGQFSTLSIKSGIHLELSSEMFGEQAAHGGQGQENLTALWSWKVLFASDPNRIVQSYEDSQAEVRKMLVPPGVYKIAFRADQHESNWVIWPDVILVEEGEWSAATLTSGIRLLSNTEELPYAWRAVKISEDPGLVQWYKGGLAHTGFMLLPPGAYRIEAQMQRRGSWHVVAENLLVRTGAITARTVDLRNP